MKKYALSLLIVFIWFLFVTHTFAATHEIPAVIILAATDETIDNYPVLEDQPEPPEIANLLYHTFIRKSLQLYAEARKYSNLPNEPLYLTFKRNSGKYGRIGFYLRKNGSLIDKRNSAYIEMGTGDLHADPARLSSITQIFPHEMGHVIIGLTAPLLKKTQIGSLDMHYSDVITDYITAFNEGFAEHFEIIAREYEENQSIKDGIVEDIKRNRLKNNPVIPRVKRDFIMPLRLDYYRGMPIFWFQTHENLKRHDLPVSGDCSYQNERIQFGNAEKKILYCHTGLYKDKRFRLNLQQSLATESVISRFFLLLRRESSLSFMEYYTKIFKVFNKYLNSNQTTPLIRFVEGYLTEYPAETAQILKTFQAATGYEFTNQIAPELWLINQGIHINRPLDQFASLKFPLYSFNLNTCEIEDLLKFKEITEKEAGLIIKYRDQHLFFNGIDELKQIKSLPEKTIAILKNNSFGNGWTWDKTRTLLNPGNGKRNPNLLSAYLSHLLARALIWFGLFFIVYYLLILRNKRELIKALLKQFFKFWLYTLLGLIAAVASMAIIKGNSAIHPLAVFAFFIVLIEPIKLFILRNNKQRFKESLISTLLISGAIIYSLI